MRCISDSASRPRSATWPRVSCWAVLRAGRGQRLRLDHHQRDVVGDDVVQLTGDAHALVADGLLGQQLALALQPLGALLEAVDVVGPRAQVQGDRHREADDDQPRDHDAGRDLGVMDDQREQSWPRR